VKILSVLYIIVLWKEDRRILVKSVTPIQDFMVGRIIAIQKKRSRLIVNTLIFISKMTKTFKTFFL